MLDEVLPLPSEAFCRAGGLLVSPDSRHAPAPRHPPTFLVGMLASLFPECSNRKQCWNSSNSEADENHGGVCSGGATPWKPRWFNTAGSPTTHCTINDCEMAIGIVIEAFANMRIDAKPEMKD